MSHVPVVSGLVCTQRNDCDLGCIAGKEVLTDVNLSFSDGGRSARPRFLVSLDVAKDVFSVISESLSVEKSILLQKGHEIPGV